MQAGDRTGGYELLEAIGPSDPRGASFVARRAGDGAFAHRVKVTVIRVASSDRMFVAMALDEARLYRAVDHQNLIQLLDLGADASHAFFVTEHVVGVTLDELRQRSPHDALDELGDPYRRSPPADPAPLGVAIAIACGVGAGLHYAHECTTSDGKALDIVHRDVAPRNVMIGFDGSVKLDALALARPFHRLRGGDDTSAMVQYLSPEQCRGRVIDRRSDIYSLATILWELTVGVPRFFRGMPDIDVLTAIAKHDVIAPSQHRVDYPPELERIVMRGLAREPDARYQTAAELVADLDTFTRTHACWASSRDISAFMHRVFPGGAQRARRLS